MNDFHGMDPEQVRDQATLLHAGSARISELSTSIHGHVTSVTWVGPDADAFREEWFQVASGQVQHLIADLDRHAAALNGQADEQDVTSESDGSVAGPAEKPSTIPNAITSDLSQGYQNTNNPWVPDWLENPTEDAGTFFAGTVSDGIGWGLTDGIDSVQSGLDRLGLNTGGIDQFQRDAEHSREVFTDWATGERVPTIAELAASGLLTVGSAGVASYELATGEDTALLDDRPGGIVHDVSSETAPSEGPQTLQDLILGNNALRPPSGEAIESGQIGIQQVQSADGGEPTYIIQVPPTEGSAISSVPDAYGGQGNSRDWGSNLRLVAGQHPAAMDDVRAAMSAPGPDGQPLVPPGSNVMFVGHSQGGIISSHLAADPTFNSSSGAEGTYNVTHSFSVGSPVQTVVPAQSGTDVVNVTHGPLGYDNGLATGDPIAHLDLQGAQIDGGQLQSPNVHEVVLDGGYDAPVGMPWLETNHDSVGPGQDASGGYAGTVDRQGADDPVLSALEADLTGVYIGEGTVVSESHVVTVGREDLR